MKKTIHTALAFAALTLFSCQKQSLPASDEINTSAEKTEAVDLRRGLMAYFPFNGNGNDESGNKFKAKLMNGAAFGTDKDGNPNSCLQLDGINDYAIVNDDGKLSASELTLVCNYYGELSNRDQTMCGKIRFSNGNGACYTLVLTPGEGGTVKELFHALNPKTGCFKQVATNYSDYVISPYNQPLGAWHNVIGTFEKGVANLYVDGRLVITKEFDYKEAKLCNYTDFMIGAWWSQGLIAFKGKLDEIRVYNRAITGREIKKLSEGF